MGKKHPKVTNINEVEPCVEVLAVKLDADGKWNVAGHFLKIIIKKYGHN